ncbi:MAG: VOC family protein [Tahibacter sp.]
MNLPPGFGTVTPYLFVTGAETIATFLVQGLGGEELQRSLRDDGKIANVQVRIGTTTLMLSEASARYPAMPASYYLYVDNADESMRRAIAHGATLEMAVQDMPYDDRQGGVRDVAGNIWWISQRLVEGPYAV